MSLPNNNDLGTLDYDDGGTPNSNAPGAFDLIGGTLDFEDGGTPYSGSEEAPPPVLMVTQSAVEALVQGRAAQLKVTQFAKEVLVKIPHTGVVTQIAVEVLVRRPPGAELGKSWNVFQPDQSVDVFLFSGDPPTSAADEVEVLNGANVILIGNEILQFRDVADLGDGHYRLSHLLRGRLGTEWAMARHLANERVVLLTESTLRRVVESTGDLDQLRFYRAVSGGQVLQQAVARGMVDSGVSLTPYAPYKVEGTRDMSDNLTITWIRRTRISGEWRDGVDAALGETEEAYEVDIIDPSDASVVRTIETTTQTAEYSATDQTTDFGAPQDIITVVVYQMSSVVGRGYPTQRNV